MTALVDPRGEELERIEEERRPRREADDQRNRDRRPEPISDRTPRQPLLLPRLECAAELVGERSEPLRRRSILAFGVLAHFLGLVRVPRLR